MRGTVSDGRSTVAAARSCASSPLRSRLVEDLKPLCAEGDASRVRVIPSTSSYGEARRCATILFPGPANRMHLVTALLEQFPRRAAVNNSRFKHCPLHDYAARICVSRTSCSARLPALLVTCACAFRICSATFASSSVSETSAKLTSTAASAVP